VNHFTFAAGPYQPSWDLAHQVEMAMIPKSVANDLTKEERLFIRRWKYGVAIIYGVAALWLVGLGVLTMSAKHPIEATSSSPHHPAIKASNL
jgi:hypothetical protein